MKQTANTFKYVYAFDPITKAIIDIKLSASEHSVVNSKKYIIQVGFSIREQYSLRYLINGC